MDTAVYRSCSIKKVMKFYEKLSFNNILLFEILSFLKNDIKIIANRELPTF